MDNTPLLSLPLLAHKQALQTTFYDEAMKALDALVMLAVIDRDLSSPPASPDEGDRYIVKAPGSGDDAWLDDHVVVYLDGHWIAHQPQPGWTCYVQDESALIAWDGAAWQPAIEVLGGAAVQNLGLLGIGTTADATNPVSAKLNNTLWTAKTVAEGGDGDLRYKLSKESAAKTLSLLFQDNFSGRAEIGLAGDDDFHFKVSADGSSWTDAIVIDRATGKLALQGFGNPTTTRAQLAASPLDALAFNGMQLNGNVDVSQELGTTGATLASGTEKYIADMIAAKYVHGAGTAVVTSAQLAAASFPAALSGYSFGHQLKATTAIGSPANGDYAFHRWYIEGYRVARLGWGASGAQSLSVGFWLHSTAAGTAFVQFSNGAFDRNHYKEVTVAGGGWQWVALTIAGDTSGTWQKTTSAGLVISLYSCGKAASPVAPNAWTATNTTQTTNSGNLLGTNNNLTIVTGLVVLPGIELPASDRAPLIMRPFDTELVQCQRYWQKSYLYGTALGAADGAGAEAFRAHTTAHVGSVVLRGIMRAGPTVTAYSTSGASGVWRDGDAGADKTFNFVSSSGSAFRYTLTSTVDGDLMAGHWVASARL